MATPALATSGQAASQRVSLRASELSDGDDFVPGKQFKPAVPNLFWHQGLVLWQPSFSGTEWGGNFTASLQPLFTAQPPFISVSTFQSQLPL